MANGGKGKVSNGNGKHKNGKDTPKKDFFRAAAIGNQHVIALAKEKKISTEAAYRMIYP